MFYTSQFIQHTSQFMFYTSQSIQHTIKLYFLNVNIYQHTIKLYFLNISHPQLKNQLTKNPKSHNSFLTYF